MELLAPAGSLEKLRFALHFGADAVYAGGELFSLRARAENFSLDDLREGIELCHDAGKRFYLAINQVIREQDLGKLREYLKSCIAAAPDALIVSDLGVISEIRKRKEMNSIRCERESSKSYTRNTETHVN